MNLSGFLFLATKRALKQCSNCSIPDLRQSLQKTPLVTQWRHVATLSPDSTPSTGLPPFLGCCLLEISDGDIFILVFLVPNTEKKFNEWSRSSQSVVPKPAVFTTENLLETQIPWPLPRMTENLEWKSSNVCINNPFRRSWCMLRFENHRNKGSGGETQHLHILDRRTALLSLGSHPSSLIEHVALEGMHMELWGRKEKHS